MAAQATVVHSEKRWLKNVQCRCFFFKIFHCNTLETLPVILSNSNVFLVTVFFHFSFSFLHFRQAANMLPEKQFYCALCQQVFTNPVTIPCGHNFCQTCIQSLWDSGEVYQCPTCNKDFNNRPEMSINTAFKELADTFKKIIVCSATTPLSAASAGDVLCDVCAATSMQVKAHKSCLVCLTSYCEIHLEPHQRVATLMLHKLMAPVKNLQDRMCKKHERLLEMFCRDDQKCVCQFCTETEHKEHQAVTVEDESGHRKVIKCNRMIGQWGKK